MSFKEFKKEDVFFNTLKTKPYFKFKIHDGNVYVNNSSTGNVSYADLNLTVASGCGAEPSLDFSCEDNSFNLAVI
jgi:hypothetical protein